MARSVIEGGSSKAAAARAFHATPKTVAKWVARFRAEGVAGLQDRSSRPRSSPSQTGSAACERVEALRRQRYTGEQIAHLASPLQLASPPWRHRSQTPNQQNRPNQGQPVEAKIGSP